MLDILEGVTHHDNGEKVKRVVNTPDEIILKTKKTRSKSKQKRKEPRKSFIATMEILRREESGATDE